MQAHPASGSILEVGTRQGKSVILMALAARDAGRKTIRVRLV